MPRRDTDRNLLFGILALQMDFVTRDALVAAMNAWVLEKHRPLGEVLVDRGALSAARRAMLEPLVDEHVRVHAEDPAASLAALSSAGGVAAEIHHSVADPEVRESLAFVPPSRAHNDLFATRATAPAEPLPAGSRYRKVREHAHGGLGVVFVAHDEELHREVALKEIKDRHAFDDPTRSRFLLEAEVTGRLEHPGIVPVYGLGHHEDGRPYYAMRFIHGKSLLDAIGRFHAEPALDSDPGARNLELQKLLRRFTDVCNAVAYAHSRGVLHRDLKPHNIMVGKYGETLVVDWGLAKATGQPGESDEDTLPEETFRRSTSSGSEETQPGQFVGTLAYASPEQAAGRLDLLGPASDVYSLGATLYHLLTGQTPFVGEIDGDPRQNVQEGRFPRPREASPWLDPALEAVCLKAMATKPEDRYATPWALADDVERWIADEPVTAWREPPSRRVRRWARRHRTAVAGTSAAMLAGLIGLSAVVGVQARSNDLLKRAGDETKESLRRAKGALDYLENDVLAAARPKGRQGGLGKDATIREAVDRAEPKIAEAFKGQPVVESDLRHMLGETYFYLGEAQLAIRQLERAVSLRREKLGPEHPDTLSSRYNLGNAYLAAGQTENAMGILEGTLRLSESTLGRDHLDTLIVRSGLAEAYLEAGRTEEAIALYLEAFKKFEAKLGPDHVRTLESRVGLANAYSEAGRTDEAIAMHEGTLRLHEARLGPEHPDTLISRDNLASAYLDAGRTKEAIELLQGTLRMFERTLGVDHPDTLTSRNGLAIAYRNAGRTEEAIAMHEGTLRLREAKLGADHPLTIQSRNNLAAAYDQAGRTTEAIALLERALALGESKLGPEDAITLTSRNNLGIAYLAAGRPLEAARLNERALELRSAKLGTEHPLTILSRNNLASSYHDAGRTSEALALWENVLPASRRVSGAGHPNTLIFTNRFAGAKEALSRWKEAEALRREVVALRRESTPAGSPLLAGDLDGLGRNLLEQGRPREAEPLLLESLSIREKALPDDWTRFNTMSLVGGALLAQGKYAEAEPLVVPGYEGMNAREARIPVPALGRRADAAIRVVRLYEEWGNVEKARSWKGRLRLTDLPVDVFAKP